MDVLRDYGQDQELVKQFFRDATYVNTDGETLPKYQQILTDLANRDLIHLLVELADVEKFNEDLAQQIITNTNRYVQIFYEAIDEILPTYKTKDLLRKDPMDVFIEQRLFIAERNRRAQQQTNTAPGSSQTAQPGRLGVVDIEGKYPPDLIRRYEISFRPSTLLATPIRMVKAETIGNLVTVRGIVTRVTDVKPQVTIATYTCDQCGYESFQIVTGEFTPLYECTSAACKANKTLGRITLQTRGSKFVKSQEIKLQEHSEQVPTGHIPRTITIMAHGELTRQCNPGDHISVSGVFLPIEKSGFRMRGGNGADTYIESHYITLMNKSEDDELDNEPLTEEEAVQLASNEENFLAKLSSSIAPEIYGHEELKKALLLLLVGGVDRSPHGMKIRGNINICLMGDPGVAKSQLLAFIDRLASRSQYTTGRGSSGVGLTAAVLKDPITNELILEGGALVLADQGICCIDEFDKMMDADRTAIHEVMEQQTVSIAKAGIMTTLNARVSILAAANPAYGRYNIHRSITDNLQLPPALLSRFDLLWLIKDQPETQRDLDLAQHITQIHMNPGDEPPNDYDAIDMKLMRKYISLCKLKQPVIPENLTEKLVQIYLDIRSKKRTSLKDDTLFTSPRSLLAILRLSTAFARLRLAEVVEQDDVDAAVALYNSSRYSIDKHMCQTESTDRRVLELIKELSEIRPSNDKYISIDDLIDEAYKNSIDKSKVMEALKLLSSYESIIYDSDTVILV